MSDIEFIKRLPEEITYESGRELVEMHKGTADGLFYIDTGDEHYDVLMSWESWVAFARKIIAADETARVGGGVKTCVLTLDYCPEWGRENQEVASERRSDLSPITRVNALYFGDQNRTQVEFHIGEDAIRTMDLMDHRWPVDCDHDSLCEELAIVGVDDSKAYAIIDTAINWVVRMSARLEVGAAA